MENFKQTKVVKRQVIKQGKLLNQYLKIKTIGEGPYSKIKLMKNIEDNKFYAMKKYNLFVLKKKNKLLKKEKGQVFYTTAAEEVFNELKILKMVNHPHISRLIQIIQDEEEEKIYLFLQYCSQGDIANWSPKNEKFTLNNKLSSVPQLRRCFRQIASSLSYLHKNNIVHRDIKPQNILIDQDLNVKLIDFGRAIKLQNSDQKLKGSEGTYHFMAPEMLSQMFPEGYDGKKCDMWSLGVSIYAILFSTLPFYDQLLIKLFAKIEKCQFTFPKEFKKDYEIFIPIISKLIALNPNDRLNADQLMIQIDRLQ